MVYAGLLFKKFTNTESLEKHKITFVKETKQQTPDKKNNFNTENTVKANWDRKFLIGFPVCFIIYNCIYWPAIIFNQSLDIQPASTWEE